MFQAKFYDQMMLLKEKTGEQERFIAQIKESMWQMTKSFNEKSQEVEIKKKKLQKASKDFSIVRRYTALLYSGNQLLH